MTNPDAFPPSNYHQRRQQQTSSRRTRTRKRVETADAPDNKTTRRIVWHETVTITTSKLEIWGEPSPDAPSAARHTPLPASRGLLGLHWTERWKLSLRGTRYLGGHPAPELDGDYILDRVYADERVGRWEHVFPAQLGLYRASLDAERAMAGDYEWVASLSGVTPGPSWSGTGSLSSAEIVLARRTSDLPEGGLQWPEHVSLTPLGWSDSSADDAAQIAWSTRGFPSGSG